MWIKTTDGWKAIQCTSSTPVPDEAYKFPQANTRLPVRDMTELACLNMPSKWKRPLW